MGKVIPLFPGCPNKSKPNLLDMLESAMPDGYCHVIVIGMDDRRFVGMELSRMDIDTAEYMIKEVHNHIKKAKKKGDK